MRRRARARAAAPCLRQIEVAAFAALARNSALWAVACNRTSEMASSYIVAGEPGLCACGFGGCVKAVPRMSAGSFIRAITLMSCVEPSWHLRDGNAAAVASCNWARGARLGTSFYNSLNAWRRMVASSMLSSQVASPRYKIVERPIISLTHTMKPLLPCVTENSKFAIGLNGNRQ